jgi:hypothetical protein
MHYLVLFSALYVTMIVYVSEYIFSVQTPVIASDRMPLSSFFMISVQMLVVTSMALDLVPWFIVGQTQGKCITAGYSGNQLSTGFWVAPLGFTISE